MLTGVALPFEWQRGLPGRQTDKFLIPTLPKEYARFMCETLFHSRLSCVILGSLWDAPMSNLSKRGAEERDACYA